MNSEQHQHDVTAPTRDLPFITVTRSDQINELATAMSRVQADIDDPSKNKQADAGGRGKYRYADLPAVLDVVRPALSKHALAVMQFPCECMGEPALTTVLAHTSGQWLQTVVLLRATKPDPQGIGSATSYARRYALLAICGVAAEDDDDGRAASATRPQPQQQQRPAHQPAPQQQVQNTPPPQAQPVQRQQPQQAPAQQPAPPQANPDGNPEFYRTTLVAVRDCRSDTELAAVKNLAKAKWGTLNQPQKDGLTVAVRAKEDQFREQAEQAQSGQPAASATYPDDVPY